MRGLSTLFGAVAIGVLAGFAPPALADPTPTPTPTPAGTVTVTTEKTCGGDAVIGTIHNGTTSPVTVAVLWNGVPAGDPVTVEPNGTGTLTVQPTITDRVDLSYVRQDTGAVIGGFHEEMWFCLQHSTTRIRVVAGTTFVSDMICPGIGPSGTKHGRVRTHRDAGLNRYEYTPARGYTGPDSFTFSCVPSAELQGTVLVTVVPAPHHNSPARPAAAQPATAQPTTAQPRLPDTGPPALPWLVAIAAASIASGAAIALLARRV